MINKGKLIRVLRTIWRLFRNVLVITTAVFLLSGSVSQPGGLDSRVRFFTRPYEFDFSTWTLGAVIRKIKTGALGLTHFMPLDQRSQLVLDYIDQVGVVQQIGMEISLMYADPAVDDPETASEALRASLDREQARLDQLAPMAEAVLQAQLMTVIKDAEIGFLGQVLPPSLYQVSPLPFSLVISPRTKIMRSMDVSLDPDLQLAQIEELEEAVSLALDVAALVVPIGGLGSYPTMVMQTTNIVWLTEVIAHEWTHNYLTLRPLGLNYATTPELRTINETTASLAGKELGLMLLKRYYPQHVPPPPPPVEETAQPAVEAPTDVFDFRLEMRITRVEVDRLLAAGEVEAAEAYMEARRQVFWENGYLIRKLNQAYFAFYGAYNDQPGGGASGEDPVGPAVVAYREQFDSLGEFLRGIAWITSFDALQAKITDQVSWSSISLGGAALAGGFPSSGISFSICSGD